MSTVNSNHNYHHESRPIDEGDARFECNICFESVKDPVVTRCGHLFCWKCLYAWLEPGLTMEEYDYLGHYRPVWRDITIDRSKRVCPVCKAKCDVRDVIPIYVKDEVCHTNTDEKTQKHSIYKNQEEGKNESSQSEEKEETNSVSWSSSNVPNRPQPRSNNIFASEENSHVTPPQRNRTAATRIYPYAHTPYPRSSILQAIIQETNRQIHSPSVVDGNENGHSTQIPSLHHRELNRQSDTERSRPTATEKSISILLLIASIFLLWVLIFE